MKKVGKVFMIIGIVFVALIVIAVIFGEEVPEQKPDDTSASKETKIEETTEKVEETTVAKVNTVGDVVELKNVSVNLLEAHEVYSDNEYIQPEEGFVFVAAQIEITNTSKFDHFFMTDFSQAYYGDVSLKSSIYALSIAGDMASGEVAPGKKIVGWCGYEVPADWTEIEFVYEDKGFSSEKATFIVKK